jgi:hypothetical protein
VSWRTLGRADVLTRRIPPWAVLGPLLVGGWLVALYVGHAAVHSGWLYYESGDATWYWTTAWMLAHGLLTTTRIGYGYSLLIAPLARIAGPSMLAGLRYVIVLNVVVLGPLALLCIYGIGKAIGGRRYAYVVSAGWVIAPVIVIPYFLADYHRRYVGLQLPANIGLTALGDFPMMVALLVSAYFVVRTLKDGDDLDAVAAGLAAGIALVVKPSGGLYLPAVFLALAVARRPRAFVAFGISLLPAVVGLALWKYRGLGYLPAFHSASTSLALGTGPIAPPVASIHPGNYLHLSWSAIQRNLDGFREFTWSRRLTEWAFVAGLIGIARRSVSLAVLLGGWLAIFFVFKGSTVANFYAGSFFRYLAPAFPAAFLLVLSLPFLVPIAGRHLAAYGRAAPPSWPVTQRARRGVVGFLGLLTLVPIVLILAFGLQHGQEAVTALSFDTLEPLNTFPVQTSVDGAAVSLSWPSRRYGTRVAYGVFRYPASISMIGCPPQSSGASACVYSPRFTKVIHAAHFTDHPGKGAWHYRIAVVAGVPPPAGDVIELSREVTVRVG